MASVAFKSIIEVILQLLVYKKLLVLFLIEPGGPVLKDVAFFETQQLRYSLCTFASFNPLPPKLKQNYPHRTK